MWFRAGWMDVKGCLSDVCWIKAVDSRCFMSVWEQLQCEPDRAGFSSDMPFRLSDALCCKHSDLHLNDRPLCLCTYCSGQNNIAYANLGVCVCSCCVYQWVSPCVAECVCMSLFLYSPVRVCVCVHVWAGLSPQSECQDVRQEQGGNEHFEELGREHAPFLHGTRLPHAERHCAPGVAEVELPDDPKNISHIEKRKYDFRT